MAWWAAALLLIGLVIGLMALGVPVAVHHGCRDRELQGAASKTHGQDGPHDRGRRAAFRERVDHGLGRLASEPIEVAVVNATRRAGNP